MISSITGILKSKSPTEAVIDVNNVGFAVNISLSTYEKIGDIGSAITLLVYLHVREDLLQLFGFFTEEERWLFKLLISVTGIGPKIAQSILSGMNVEELKLNITQGNVNALMSVPGIGRKTAERLILELKEKISKSMHDKDIIHTESITDFNVRNEALQALVSLGYNQQIAEKAVRMVLKEEKSSKISVEELIKKALRFTSIK